MRKMTLYNPNVDLVNDNVYTKFSYIQSIHSQDIEQIPNSDINQGPQICENDALQSQRSVDLVNDNVYTKFGLINSVHSFSR